MDANKWVFGVVPDPDQVEDQKMLLPYSVKSAGGVIPATWW